MKTDISVKIELSFSKIMAFLILVVTTWYSIANHEVTVITLGVMTVGAILGWKQHKDKQKLEIYKKNEIIK